MNILKLGYRNGNDGKHNRGTVAHRIVRAGPMSALIARVAHGRDSAAEEMVLAVGSSQACELHSRDVRSDPLTSWLDEIDPFFTEHLH